MDKYYSLSHRCLITPRQRLSLSTMSEIKILVWFFPFLPVLITAVRICTFLLVLFSLFHVGPCSPGHGGWLAAVALIADSTHLRWILGIAVFKLQSSVCSSPGCCFQSCGTTRPLLSRSKLFLLIPMLIPVCVCV